MGNADTNEPAFYIFHGLDAGVVQMRYDAAMTDTTGAVVIATLSNLGTPCFRAGFKGHTFVQTNAFIMNNSPI